MLLEFVPEKSRSHAKLCKKMKKRKQLDALVSCSKPKRFKNSSFANSSSHGLLKNCSDSSDLEDFSLNRKRRPPKHMFTMRKCNAVFSIILFILVTACIIATATLVWLHLILRSNLEILRLHLQKVESSGEETPRNLHSLHSKIQQMTANIETFQEKLEHTSASVTKNEKELTSLQQTSAQLKESLASAPEIHGLPKTIQSLSENLATIGSKILALETMVKDLKVQLVELHGSHQQETSDLEMMKTNVHQLWKEVKTQRRNVENNETNTQTQLLYHLQEEVDKLNQSLGNLNGTLLPQASNLNNSLNLAMQLFSKQQAGKINNLVNLSSSQVSKLLPDLEEMVTIYSYLKHQLNVSHPIDLINASISHFLLQNPKLKTLIQQVSRLEADSSVLRQKMEELGDHVEILEEELNLNATISSASHPTNSVIPTVVVTLEKERLTTMEHLKPTTGSIETTDQGGKRTT